MAALWQCSTGEGVIPSNDAITVWFTQRLSAADMLALPGMRDPLSDEEQD